jgi:hypothetical protein
MIGGMGYAYKGQELDRSYQVYSLCFGTWGMMGSEHLISHGFTFLVDFVSSFQEVHFRSKKLL